MRTTKVLVPLDGSPVSEAALPFAEAIAHRTHATLALIRAVQGQSQSVIKEAEVYLAGFQEGLERRGLTVETGVSFAAAADLIVDEVALRNADLVIMATQDRTGRDRWVRGSVAEAVISRADKPVLVVRAAEGMRPAERFQHRQPVLVVPLDGSEFAEAALPFAAQFAHELGGAVVLVSVLPDAGQPVYAEGMGVAYNDRDTERLRQDAQSYLDDVAARLGAVGTSVCFGDPAGEIVAEAEQRGAAAVVMATHGRTGVMRSLLGSVAGHVVHAGLVPVALVRPDTPLAAQVPPSDSARAATIG